MLRYISYDIVFREVPDELTLAINITNCPNKCKGCHSPHLQENIGEALTNDVLEYLIKKYGDSISCICFMGGDIAPKEVEQLAKYTRLIANEKIKTAWYSGKSYFPTECDINNFHYIKLGPYVEKYGGLDKCTTNQRFYKIEDGKIIDITKSFYS